MFGKRGVSEDPSCPQCGSTDLRELRMTDYNFGDSEVGHYESECRDCGWNSQHPDPVPCPGCGADLRRRDAIVHVLLKGGTVVAQAPKHLLGDGSRYGMGGVDAGVGDWDETLDRCVACGYELGRQAWGT